MSQEVSVRGAGGAVLQLEARSPWRSGALARAD
jgi:hypothetical protein